MKERVIKTERDRIEGMLRVGEESLVIKERKTYTRDRFCLKKRCKEKKEELRDDKQTRLYNNIISCSTM
jgi:hypothetical protein